MTVAATSAASLCHAIDMTTKPQPADFADIARLVTAARQRAMQAVNTTLIDLYWQIGERISRKIAASEWGDGVWINWHAIWRKPSRGSGDSPDATCFGCGISMRHIPLQRLCQHC